MGHGGYVMNVSPEHRRNARGAAASAEFPHVAVHLASLQTDGAPGQGWTREAATLREAARLIVL